MSAKFGRGTLVVVRNNDLNGALRKFKRKVQSARIFQDLKDREYPVTKGQKRRRAKASARIRYLIQKRTEEGLDLN
jgi:ribosomal protein S21